MFYNVSLPMVIRKIEICNFRIFYKENAFELLDGLNLILGWHGDGKTTFFDALDGCSELTEQTRWIPNTYLRSA